MIAVSKQVAVLAASSLHAIAALVHSDKIGGRASQVSDIGTSVLQVHGFFRKVFGCFSDPDNKIVGSYVFPRSEELCRHRNGTRIVLGKNRKTKNSLKKKAVAIKIIPTTCRNFKVVDNEIAIHEVLSGHPRVVTLVDVIKTKDKTYLVMEKAKTDLYNAFKDEDGSFKAPSDGVARRLYGQVIDGVQHLHNQGIIHRDLKLANILLDENDDVKICDFGFADFVANRKPMLNAGKCTKMYAAQELVEFLVSDRKFDGILADIWSLGVIGWQLFCGNSPFYRNKRHGLLIENGFPIFSQPVCRRKSVPEDVMHLLRGMLVHDTAKRFKWKDINGSDFMKAWREKYGNANPSAHDGFGP